MYKFTSQGKTAMKKAMTSHASWKSWMADNGKNSGQMTIVDIMEACDHFGINVRQFSKGYDMGTSINETLAIAEKQASPAPKAAPALEGMEAQINDLMQPLGTGDMDGFKAKAKALIEAANKPAQTKTVYAPGAAPAIADGKVAGTETANIIFGPNRALRGITMDVYDDSQSTAADPDYIFNQDALGFALCCMNRGKNIYLYGPAGTGKTSFPMEIAARLGRSVEVINCTRALEPDQLIGQPGLKDGNTFWQD